MATATYLYIGLEAQARHHGPTATFPEHLGGFMGLVSELDRFAALLDEWAIADEALGIDCPGVFDYDITEPMGTWLYGHIDCSDEEFIAELTRLVAEWRAAA